jgi:hypothetical protein
MILANQVLAKVEDGRQLAGGWIAESFGLWCNASSVMDKKKPEV